ncbi:helix-hairpin-helix domain-containing protein, partial [Cribrihabitans sp. XS_ASV171]
MPGIYACARNEERPEMTPVSKIRGVGPVLARLLAAHGFDTAEAIAATTPEALAAVPRIGVARAPALIAAAR